MSGSRGSSGKAGGGKSSSRPRSGTNRPSAQNRTVARSGAGSSSLYERYKDALRRGHVAALRGRNDAAIEAYQEAASIAPDRALPHASGPLSVLQFPNGSANLTYLLRLGAADELVLRRPPMGELAPGAHDMKREFKVLSRLWQHFDRAPRAYVFCAKTHSASAFNSDFATSR